jgi:hypothetical protein
MQLATPRADLIRLVSPAGFTIAAATGPGSRQRSLSALIFSPAAVLKADN